ncbi:peptidase domain-containing ABC transporter [Capnocytophaga catalasegens]|uniref:Bacteriocin cleavage/export ABC transporter n=1 Tax=Capnocytophaga catalasegens TaxID=1004260 RepID=A0AAV5AUG1_9FLAO|nr:peptidase domain-containing ABC transporter [Capnocytophaga catalasegens]GIZ14084.1 bacteriocin cleavage/export ABC transporter [Capnocytophaga catalasegens]GJM49082.1 bacteriocin cleavage/export ABC transporter [Capnocytophaga catalasegens]GJM52343.1 bacteriocin cleavage/export ABC transporter [Capnocytophaga catalasegens]
MFDKKRIKKSVVLQHDQNDCGVACLLSLIRYYGGNQSLEKLREYSGTTRQGTTLLGLYQAANKVGFTAEGCEADIQSLINHPSPTILHVVLEEKLQHYVVCFGYENKKFIIGDPAQGIYELSVEELEKIWISHSCLTLEPNADFVLDKDDKIRQRQWFLSLLKDDYKLLISSTIIGILVAVLAMAMMVFSQKLIDDILPSHNKNKLVVGIVLLTLLLLARVGLSLLRSYFLLKQAKDFNIRINTNFFTRLLSLPKPFFDTRKIGELVARLNDTQRIQRVINQLVNSLVIDVLVTIVSLIFLFFYSWQIGVITLLSVPIYFFIVYRSNQSLIKAQREIMQNYALVESNYITSMQGIETIKNNNRQAFFAQNNTHIFSFLQQKSFNLGILGLKLSWQSGVASIVFLVVTLFYASFQVFDNQLQLGAMMAILGISGSLLPSVANLALITIPINEAKIAFSRMYEFASVPCEKVAGEDIKKIDTISVENLSFRFAGRKELFSDVNLTLKKGQITALIGESGCGKSTFGQLLQQFYTPEKGVIKVNNRNIETISLQSYRNMIGVIPQEVTIFNGNVVDNILLGDKSLSEEEFYLFLQKYGFDTYFNQFPQGIATLLGEEGINLSGGQKQLIALARALYKKPQFLLLDEATSAMDRNTEKFAIELLKKIKPHCIILFISHRLHLLSQIADNICILENTITYNDTPSNLLKTSNFYSQYWKK